MTVNDIIALTNAGWSREEILRMSGIAQEPAQQEPAQQEPAAPAQQEPVQPAPAAPAQQAAAPAQQAPAIPGLDALTAKLDNLLTGLQSSALLNAQQPPHMTEEEKALASLAEIINPPVNIK